MSARRYIVMLQDPRGYPAKGAADLDDLVQPEAVSVVKVDAYEALEAELEAAREQARTLAGAIRSTLGSVPFQPPEAIGSLVVMKLRGPLAEYERDTAEGGPA